MWHGKVIGALLGMILSKGNPWGIVIGVIAGHYFDTQAMKGQTGNSANPRDIQDAFFRATFKVMGHVAKADGRVSEEEIRAARAVMNQFRLGEPEVRLAIELFTEGKASDFPLEETVARLANLLYTRPDLRRMFVQIQLQTALWGDGMHTQARAMLVRICQGLGVSEFELAQMEAILRMQRSSGQYSRSGQSGQSQQRYSRDNLADSYGVLGVTPQATDAEVTKAYRRQMSQNHPDKLAAKGLPESMKTVAEEKTKQIRSAYEAICEARGMK
jgi:DnaJ like chaperone protein